MTTGSLGSYLKVFKIRRGTVGPKLQCMCNLKFPTSQMPELGSGDDHRPESIPDPKKQLPALLCI